MVHRKIANCLDPARPLIHAYGSKAFRLTPDDAQVVQVLHTNAGLLGEIGQLGHVDFCINGGVSQPTCKGNPIRRSRCSHFLSACYYAAAVRRSLRLIGVPCKSTCPKLFGNWGLEGTRAPVVIGDEIPPRAKGMYCVKVDHDEECPFD